MKKLMQSLLVCALLLAVVFSERTGAAQAQDAAVSGTLSNAPAWSSIGQQVGGEYGYAVSLAGDFNRDGRRDLLVGAPKNSASIDREGIVQVFYGVPGISGVSLVPDRVYAGGLQGSGFGISLAAVGDVNGDGYEDALIGANRWQDDKLLPNQGAAFLYCGSAIGLRETAAWMKLSGQKDAEFGYSVASAGDVNSDGYADLVIGARYYYNGYNNEGAAFLFLGGAGGPSDTADWSTYGGSAVAAYGSAVSGVGDVNGDGYDDVLVGAPGYKVGGTQAGAVFLFYGKQDGLEPAASWSYISPTLDAWLGGAVSPAGDLNRDGYADFLVGMPGYDGADGTLLSAGGVLVFYGSADGPADAPQIQILGGQAFARLGSAVAAAGDVNLDGVADILYSAYNYSDDQPQEGIVYLASGAAISGELPVLWTVTGDKSEATLGFALSAGDANGDGFIDLAVGAPDYKKFTDKLGAAFLYLGCLDLSGYPMKVFLPALFH